MTQAHTTLAPVVLFAYNRPSHTRITLTALASARLANHSRLYVFVDGPRTMKGQSLTRAVLEAVTSFDSRFAELTIVKRKSNMGLAASIIAGVTDIVGRHGRVIVLEDDIVVSPGFLEYMNWALDTLAQEKLVGSIHGYCYPGINLPGSYFYMKGGDCWGWATWQDRWSLFETDGRHLLRQLLSCGRMIEFTMGGAAPYCRMLCGQILGRNNSWAVRWHASLFLSDRLTLYPCQTIVQNIGLDGSGEHCGNIRTYDALPVEDRGLLPRTLPPLVPSTAAKREFVRFFAKNGTAVGQLARRLSGMLLDLLWIIRVRPWS